MDIIRRFEGTEADYVAYVDLKLAVWTHEPASVEAQRLADSRRDDTLLNRRDLVFDPEFPDRVIGAADYYHLPYGFHPQRFGFMIIVAPTARRQGLATRLYQHMLGELAPRHPISLESAAYEAEPAGIVFLEALGFEQQLRHQMSELDPAEFDPEAFRDTLDAVEASGIVIRTLREVLAADPAAVGELRALTLELSRDAPWYTDVTKPPLEEWRREYVDSTQTLPDGFFIAFDGDTMIGMSALHADDTSDAVLHTRLTGVKRGYRRRGIATAMKVRTLEYAASLRSKAGRPPIIETGNAADNPMLELNLRLGFQPKPAWRIYWKDLTATA